MLGMLWRVFTGLFVHRLGMSKEEAMKKYIECIEGQKVKYA